MYFYLEVCKCCTVLSICSHNVAASKVASDQSQLNYQIFRELFPSSICFKFHTVVPS